MCVVCGKGPRLCVLAADVDDGRPNIGKRK
jgi:hypothetical protein